MYRKTVKLSIALMIALVIAGFGLIGCKKAAQAAESARPNVPDGYVLVEEDVLLQFVELPGEHFHKARESFLKKDLKGAASEIRKGEAFLRLQAARATAEGKKGLIASVAELEKLANDVEKGTVTSAKRLDRTFAKSHHALARHHYLKAMEYRTKKDTKRLGQSLRAAAVHLEHGFAWAGHELEAVSVRAIKDVGLLAGKLVEGTGWVAEEVGKAIEKIGQEVDKLGKLL
ncbi:MAG: hypothetical protein ISS70_21895 [Phycisphaerae bacterium]|nr:hypothetical protein [Phycisphaerae bacterium]